MKTIKEDSVYPKKGHNFINGETYDIVGLTKREYFAVMVMVALNSTDKDIDLSAKDIAETAVNQADALIEL